MVSDLTGQIADSVTEGIVGPPDLAVHDDRQPYRTVFGCHRKKHTEPTCFLPLVSPITASAAFGRDGPFDTLLEGGHTMLIGHPR